MKMEPFPGELTKKWLDRPFTTKTGKQGCQRVLGYELTDEQKDWLRRWFPEVENSQLMAASGMAHSTLHRTARELGLKKSDAGKHRIMKAVARRAKRTNEKSGYYDSLRGKKPSEAVMQGTAKMWADIREGRREHPSHVLKHTHPRRYAQWMKRRSEARKEVIRKEARRMLYGFARKTKLRVVLCKYTRSQTGHRYNAVKRGYILSDDCSEQGEDRYVIYYDDTTPRSDRFERNCVADGFKFAKWNY